MGGRRCFQPDNVLLTYFYLVCNCNLCASCETWSLTLREEYRLRVFESRIVRRVFGPKGILNGEWRRLHNEELNSLYRAPNIVRVIKSRRLRWAGHVARMEEGRRALEILTGKPTEKRPSGRPRHR